MVRVDKGNTLAHMHTATFATTGTKIGSDAKVHKHSRRHRNNNLRSMGRGNSNQELMTE